MPGEALPPMDGFSHCGDPVRCPGRVDAVQRWETPAAAGPLNDPARSGEGGAERLVWSAPALGDRKRARPRPVAQWRCGDAASRWRSRLAGQVRPSAPERPFAEPAQLCRDPAANAAEPPARMVWLDRAKGLGIVLVVTGHALGGLIDSPLGAGLTGFRAALFAIYTFHMPLFLFLAGLLVRPRLERGRSAFLRALAPAVVWPYFLWSIVQFSVIWTLGSAVNRPAGPWLPAVLALPWRPQAQFWFLYALFWMHLSAAALVPRWGGRR